MKQITAQELQQMLETTAAAPVLLDVREDRELAICQIAGSLHIPMGQVPAELSRLQADAPVVAICHHGARSYQVAMFLEQQGFSDVYNLQGGIDGWAREIDPDMARY